MLSNPGTRTTDVRDGVLVPAEMTAQAVTHFEEELTRVLRKKPRTVELDCTELGQITSGHIGLLWQAKQDCATVGAAARLHAPSPGLMRVLFVMDLQSEFESDNSSMATMTTESGRIPIPFPTTEYVDQFAPTGASMTLALGRFLDFMASLGVRNLSAFELRTVFYEIANNIVSHGQLAEDDVIDVTVRTGPYQISMTFSDGGEPFDPTSKVSCVDMKDAAKRRQRRGLGLTVIRKLSDRVVYRRVDGTRNELTIQKKCYRG